MLPWTDPPLVQRQATPEGVFSIAYISEDDGGREKSGVFKSKTIEDARALVGQIISEGGISRIFDKDGLPTT